MYYIILFSSSTWFLALPPDTFTSHQYHPVRAQVTPHPESFLFPQGTTLGLRTTNRPTLCQCEGHSTFSSHSAVLQENDSYRVLFFSLHLGCHDCRSFSVWSTLSNNQRTHSLFVYLVLVTSPTLF